MFEKLRAGQLQQVRGAARFCWRRPVKAPKATLVFGIRLATILEAGDCSNGEIRRFPFGRRKRGKECQQF